MNVPISDAMILIVDDHIDNLRVLSDILKELPFFAKREGRVLICPAISS